MSVTCVLVLLFLSLSWGHHCNPELAKIKNELSKRIDQSLYRYYDLQAQTKTNFNQIKKMISKGRTHPVQIPNFCKVDRQLESLYKIIEEYQRLWLVVRPDQNYHQLATNFEKTASEVEEKTARCIEVIKILCS